MVRCYGLRWGSMLTFAVLFSAASMMVGCAQTGEGARRDALTQNVGNYSSPPAGVERPRIGIPSFTVEGTQAQFDFSAGRLEGMAADQLTTLMHQTNRFSVIERTQLNQLLAEQGLEGIVEAGELAQPAQVRGVDYLVLGKITAFRVTAEEVSQEVGVQRGVISQRFLDGWTGGVDQRETILTSEMGIDLRIVDPTTGEIKVADFTQYRQEDTASSFGVDIAGVGGSGDAAVQVSEDDAGRLMRLAFDDVVRKMLPEIDSRVLPRAEAADAGTASQGQAEQVQEQAGPRFCSQCGEQVASGVRFCGECGTQIQ